MTPRRRPVQEGASLVECLAVAALLGLLMAGVVPGARKAWAREEGELVMRRVVSDIRAKRSDSIGSSVARALLFEKRPDGPWTVTLARDGDGDGVRADDVRRGVDPILEGPDPFDVRYAGARLGFHPSITQLRSPPPTSAPLGNLDDPVRLGLGDAIGFTSRGTMTSGTLYLTDGTERQFAVVCYGMTGRVRAWEYDVDLRRWIARF